METILKSPIWGRNLLIISIMIGVLISVLPIFGPKTRRTEANFDIPEIFQEQLIIVQGNSLLPIANPSNPEPQSVQRIRVVITGYSSTPWETDGDPYLTAAGTRVREGVTANNYLSFGTKFRIPELFGDKVFVIEDRMSWKKGNYHIDIWFPDYWQALNFGAKRTYIEILES